jgi:hypothetical protein
MGMDYPLLIHSPVSYINTTIVLSKKYSALLRVHEHACKALNPEDLDQQGHCIEIMNRYNHRPIY